MYQVKTDLHTHTLWSGHAFSTIEENAIHAVEAGMEAIGMADHFSPLFSPCRPDGSPEFGPMMNMSALPRVIHGVRVLAGVEIDIVDLEGHLYTHDLFRPFGPPAYKNVPFVKRVLDTREVTIASVHMFPGHHNASPEESTRMYVNVLKTPGVHILGHPARSDMPFDIHEVVHVAKEENKLIEINEHSFDSDEHIQERIRRLAEECAAQGTSIVVNSDAHSAFFIGQFSRAFAMLESIDFPQKLIANESLAKLAAFLPIRE